MAIPAFLYVKPSHLVSVKRALRPRQNNPAASAVALKQYRKPAPYTAPAARRRRSDRSLAGLRSLLSADPNGLPYP